MFLQIYIFFTLLFVSVISSEWKNFPNKCNATCLNENLKQTINDSDCLPWDQWPKILKPKNFTISGKHCILLNEESPIHVCPKMINGKKMLASCGNSFNDFRISCIPTESDSEDEKDLFEWYRGIKSTTFNGTKCLRWDEIDFIGNKFSAFFDFTETSFGSQTFGIHSHENFCRNPDKWSAGPWCYIKGGKVPVRQPCFNQCKRSEEKFLATPEASLNPCLSRLFFLSIFSLKNLPTANFYLSNLPMKNRPKWISQYLIQNTQYLNSKFCYFRDSRANYFGPWTFKPSPSDIQFRSYQTFANDSDLHGDSWERCYFSCEDLVLKCLPSIKFNYFGPKQITVDGTQCISPNILANRLQETFAKFNNNETNFKMYKPELWQFWKLFTSDKLGNVENLFFKNSVDRLLNPQCYNFRLFISKIDFLEFSALKQIFQNGVGCFIAKPENEIQLTSVIFEPCFIQCPPNTSEPIFSIEPVLFENETYHTTIFEEKQIHSGNFEDKLDRGDSTATIILLTFSCLSLIAEVEEDNNKTLKDVADSWMKSDPNFKWSPKRNISIDHIFKNLPLFQKEVQCPILFNPSHSNYISEVEKASKWKYKVSEAEFWKEIENDKNSGDICESIKTKYSFLTEPLSLEEFEYPIAYGMLIIKDIRQLTFMLSAFYQPQNAYCIAIDGKATKAFKNRMKIFQSCFPNIHVFIVNTNVSWCGPEIPTTVLSCVQKLNELNHPWRYYQYLSGVDLPLKTNLEMVRIFKALNGTFNANVYDVFQFRYLNRGPLPLPILISSLSATFSRASANVISTHPLVYKLLNFLQKTHCPDESMWATLAGNPEYIKMPGGFSSKQFLPKIQSEILDKSNRTKLSLIPRKNSFQLQYFYISRYQEFLIKNFTDNCNGTFKSGSCVFDVGHLPILLVRPELVVHKLYLDIHPASFFCLYQKIRERALEFENQKNFDASNYENLPQVQLSRGKSINDVQFFF